MVIGSKHLFGPQGLKILCKKNFKEFKKRSPHVVLVTVKDSRDSRCWYQAMNRILFWPSKMVFIPCTWSWYNVTLTGLDRPLPSLTGPV